MPDIVLRDRNGNPLNFTGADYLDVLTPDGETASYVHSGLIPEIVENLPIALDFSNGDQTVTAQEGVAVKSAIIQKPGNLIPENIADGVNIAGIIGSMVTGGGNAVAKWGQLFKNSDTTKVIEHGLGVVPDFFAFFTYGGPGKDYYSAAYGFSEAGATLAGRTGYYRSCGFRINSDATGLGSVPTDKVITDAANSTVDPPISDATDTIVKLNGCGAAPYFWIAIGGLT